MRSTAAIVACSLAMLALAGCGNDDDADRAATAPSTATTGEPRQTDAPGSGGPVGTEPGGEVTELGSRDPDNIDDEAPGLVQRREDRTRARGARQGVQCRPQQPRDPQAAAADPAVRLRAGQAEDHRPARSARFFCGRSVRERRQLAGAFHREIEARMREAGVGDTTWRSRRRARLDAPELARLRNGRMVLTAAGRADGDC